MFGFDKMHVFKFKNEVLIQPYTKEMFIKEYNTVSKTIDAKNEWEKQRKIIERKPLEKRFSYINLNDSVIVFSNGLTAKDIMKNLGYIIDENDLSFELYRDKELIDYIQRANIEQFTQERYLVKDLQYYINNKPKNVCCLYGLRRTGKTVAILQTINKLIKENKKCVYIMCSRDTKLKELINTIKYLIKNNYSYIFLDEITYVEGFLQNANIFSDSLAIGSTRIVLAGTDSYILNLVENDLLYGRLYSIPTTFISFNELKMLYPKKTYLDYIEHGGVLDIDTYGFYKKEHSDNYIDSSIINNIKHSIEMRCDNSSSLSNLVNNELLSSVIYNIIQKENNMFIIEIIMSAFSNNDLTPAVSILSKDYDYSTLDKKQILNSLKKAVNYSDKLPLYISETNIEQLKNILKKLNIFEEYDYYIDENKPTKRYLISQPGLRFQQIKDLLDVLAKDSNFMNLIDENSKEALKTKILEVAEGHLIEHNIICHLLQSSLFRNNKDAICQVRINDRQEIDLVIVNENNIDLFEIKRSSNIYQNQMKWLVDEEINNFCEERFSGNIRSRNVLYLGDSTTTKLNNKTINYINIETFLSKFDFSSERK